MKTRLYLAALVLAALVLALIGALRSLVVGSEQPA
jgi:hypothetical protein